MHYSRFSKDYLSLENSILSLGRYFDKALRAHSDGLETSIALSVRPAET